MDEGNVMICNKSEGSNCKARNIATSLPSDCGGLQLIRVDVEYE